jgi:tryptophanyl-tRNA synthetase
VLGDAVVGRCCENPSVSLLFGAFVRKRQILPCTVRERVTDASAIRQYIALQDNEQAFYFIADLHALTTIRDAESLSQYCDDAALDLLALGLDPNQAALFRQSDVPEVTDLTWLLLTVTQMSLLEKCVSYKDKKAKGIVADAGLFTYPILMAADILLYDSDIVPVGSDQIQHIEVTRDVAQRFNTIYQKGVLTLPEPRVLDESARVPGVDGEKMSKSYNNTLPLFDTPKKTRKRIMSIKTDSTALEDPKDPETCNVFALYRLFATEEQQQELAERYRKGGMGYGEAKQVLYESYMEHFADARQRREELAADPDTLKDILQTGAQKAREKGREVLERVRSACGLGSVPSR